jgi:hypothetical protein
MFGEHTDAQVCRCIDWSFSMRTAQSAVFDSQYILIEQQCISFLQNHKRDLDPGKEGPMIVQDHRM